MTEVIDKFLEERKKLLSDDELWYGAVLPAAQQLLIDAAVGLDVWNSQFKRWWAKGYITETDLTRLSAMTAHLSEAPKVPLSTRGDDTNIAQAEQTGQVDPQHIVPATEGLHQPMPGIGDNVDDVQGQRDQMESVMDQSSAPSTACTAQPESLDEPKSSLPNSLIAPQHGVPDDIQPPTPAPMFALNATLNSFPIQMTDAVSNQPVTQSAIIAEASGLLRPNSKVAEHDVSAVGAELAATAQLTAVNSIAGSQMLPVVEGEVSLPAHSYLHMYQAGVLGAGLAAPVQFPAGAAEDGTVPNPPADLQQNVHGVDIEAMQGQLEGQLEGSADQAAESAVAADAAQYLQEADAGQRPDTAHEHQQNGSSSSSITGNIPDMSVEMPAGVELGLTGSDAAGSEGQEEEGMSELHRRLRLLGRQMSQGAMADALANWQAMITQAEDARLAPAAGDAASNLPVSTDGTAAQNATAQPPPDKQDVSGANAAAPAADAMQHAADEAQEHHEQQQEGVAQTPRTTTEQAMDLVFGKANHTTLLSAAGPPQANMDIAAQQSLGAQFHMQQQLPYGFPPANAAAPTQAYSNGSGAGGMPGTKLEAVNWQLDPSSAKPGVNHEVEAADANRMMQQQSAAAMAASHNMASMMAMQQSSHAMASGMYPGQHGANLDSFVVPTTGGGAYGAGMGSLAHLGHSGLDSMGTRVIGPGGIMMTPSFRPPGQNPRVCFDFAKGICHRGTLCRFSHDLTAVASYNSRERPLCLDLLHNRWCPRGNHCRFSHDLTRKEPLSVSSAPGGGIFAPQPVTTTTTYTLTGPRIGMPQMQHPQQMPQGQLGPGFALAMRQQQQQQLPPQSGGFSLAQLQQQMNEQQPVPARSTMMSTMGGHQVQHTGSLMLAQQAQQVAAGAGSLTRTMQQQQQPGSGLLLQQQQQQQPRVMGQQPGGYGYMPQQKAIQQQPMMLQQGSGGMLQQHTGGFGFVQQQQQQQTTQMMMMGPGGPALPPQQQQQAGFVAMRDGAVMLGKTSQFPCTDFARGRCYRGASCRFSHTMPLAINTALNPQKTYSGLHSDALSRTHSADPSLVHNLPTFSSVPGGGSIPSHFMHIPSTTPFQTPLGDALKSVQLPHPTHRAPMHQGLMHQKLPGNPATLPSFTTQATWMQNQASAAAEGSSLAPSSATGWMQNQGSLPGDLPAEPLKQAALPMMQFAADTNLAAKGQAQQQQQQQQAGEWSDAEGPQRAASEGLTWPAHAADNADAPLEQPPADKAPANLSGMWGGGAVAAPALVQPNASKPMLAGQSPTETHQGWGQAANLAAPSHATQAWGQAPATLPANATEVLGSPPATEALGPGAAAASDASTAGSGGWRSHEGSFPTWTSMSSTLGNWRGEELDRSLSPVNQLEQARSIWSQIDSRVEGVVDRAAIS